MEKASKAYQQHFNQITAAFFAAKAKKIIPLLKKIIENLQGKEIEKGKALFTAPNITLQLQPDAELSHKLKAVQSLLNELTSTVKKL